MSESQKADIAIYNPLKYDFSYPWKDEKNQEHILTIPTNDSIYFPYYQAHFMAKHIADAIINEMPSIVTNYEDERKKVLDIIYIKSGL